MDAWWFAFCGGLILGVAAAFPWLSFGKTAGISAIFGRAIGPGADSRWRMAFLVKQQLASWAAGVLFGLGLGVARATRPDLVLGFLNFGADWNPRLLYMFVGSFVARSPAL